MTTNQQLHFPGAALFRRLAHEARVRHSIRQMEAMDDHLLRDVGANRNAIRRAVRGLD